MAAIVIGGCGGGGGASSSAPGSSGSTSGGSGSGSQQSPPPVQITFAASPTSVKSGGSATLTWSSESSACTAGNGWSGAKSGSGSLVIGPLTQTTTFSLSCAATATASTGQNNVTVTATAPTPAPTASEVVSNSGETSLSYFDIDAQAADLAWDPTHSQLLVVTQATSPLAPNSLVAIDPTTGTMMQAVSLGATPSAVAISADGLYAYVGLAGGVIRRFLAAGLSPDITFSVGNASSAIGEIDVSPISAHTIAVVASDLGGDTSGYYDLAIFDDGVARPEVLTNSSLNYSASWSSDASQVFVSGGGDVPTVLDVAVTPQGVSLESRAPWIDGNPVTVYGSTVYSLDGAVYSLTGVIQRLGRMPDYDALNVSRTESISLGKAFSAETNLDSGAIQDGTIINAFDLNQFTYIDSITFNGAALVASGKLITWGSNGLAMAGSELLIASGSFAGAGGAPLPQSLATPPNLVSGTTADGSLSFQVLNTSANDVAADSCGHLFVATSASAPLYPSSVLEMDADSDTVTGAVVIPGEPNALAVSGDCTTLYAALAESNAVERVQVSDLTLSAELPLGLANSGFFVRGESLDVAPGYPDTVAVSEEGMDQQFLCDSDYNGVAIFDGVTERPVQYGEGQGYTIQSIAWGADSSVMYGEDWNGAYAFSVDASGAYDPTLLFPYWAGDTGIYDLGRDLYFDRAANRLFNSAGNVFDLTANAALGPIKLVNPVSLINDCGTPSVARVSDQTSGKIFFVTYDSSATPTIDIAAYDKTTLDLIGHETLDAAGYAGGLSWPLRVVRPDSDSLAVVTASGQLILLRGPLLEP